MVYGYLLNSAIYVMGWLIIVHAAAGGSAWEGVLLALVVAISHLFYVQNPGSELVLMLFAMLSGFAIESFFIYCGIISFASPNHLFPHLAPLWMISLYALFSTTINHSLFLLGRSFMTAAIFGFIGSICSYYLGYRLGAAQLLLSTSRSLLVIGSVWFFFLPILFRVNQAISNFRNHHVH